MTSIDMTIVEIRIVSQNLIQPYDCIALRVIDHVINTQWNDLYYYY